MAVILSGNSLAKPIGDATAVSSDVAFGKIFYNNDGRQVGSANILEIQTCTSGDTQIGTVTSGTTFSYGSISYEYKNYRQLETITKSETTRSYYSSIKLNGSAILFEVDGKKIIPVMGRWTRVNCFKTVGLCGLSYLYLTYDYEYDTLYIHHPNITVKVYTIKEV